MSKETKSTTQLIHIGKCGGSSLTDGLKHAEKNSDNIEIVHIRKPIFYQHFDYIIVSRGPIARLYSAFNWRYKLVVLDKEPKQVSRFKDEKKILEKYQNLNNIAEQLYQSNGDSNIEVQRELLTIHHIKENISFYLSDLLNQCSPKQIKVVLLQENLNEDIYNYFGYKNNLLERYNGQQKHHGKLSQIAILNLRKFFYQDFNTMHTLYCWGKINKEVYMKMIEDN